MALAGSAILTFPDCFVNVFLQENPFPADFPALEPSFPDQVFDGIDAAFQ
jgi:hypothetical protein